MSFFRYTGDLWKAASNSSADSVAGINGARSGATRTFNNRWACNLNDHSMAVAVPPPDALASRRVPPCSIMTLIFIVPGRHPWFSSSASVASTIPVDNDIGLACGELSDEGEQEIKKKVIPYTINLAYLTSMGLLLMTQVVEGASVN